MKFWLTNAGTQFTWLPRIRASSIRFSIRWLGVVLSIKWGNQ